MESSGFYVQLPSNASMDLFPSNKMCCYKTQLPRTLNFQHTYEVGLVEIQYPNSWNTFHEEKSYTVNIEYYPGFGKDFAGGMDYDPDYSDIEEPVFQSVVLPRAQYSSVTELMDKVQLAVNQVGIDNDWGENILTITEDSLERKLTFYMKPDIFVHFSDEFCDVVGFPKGTYRGGTVHTTHRYDITHGFRSLYVYCDICEPQFVGDVMVPLLRTVAIQGERGDYVTNIYDVPHYIPVSLNGISTIEINIKDDTGEDVPFIDGKVMCKLHFRPKTI